MEACVESLRGLAVAEGDDCAFGGGLYGVEFAEVLFSMLETIPAEV